MIQAKEYYTFYPPIVRLAVEEQPGNANMRLVVVYGDNGFMGKLEMNVHEATEFVKRNAQLAIPAASFYFGTTSISRPNDKRRGYIDGHTMGGKGMPRLMTYDELESELNQLRNQYIEENGNSTESGEAGVRHAVSDTRGDH